MYTNRLASRKKIATVYWWVEMDGELRENGRQTVVIHADKHEGRLTARKLRKQEEPKNFLE